MTTRFFENQLAVRLVIYSLMIGSVLSVFSTGVQLLYSYQQQKNDAALVLNEIDKTLKSSLTFALWRLDFVQIDVILDGLETNDAVSYLLLRSNTGEVWERGVVSSTDVVGEFQLVHREGPNSEVPVGTLTVEVSLATVSARVWDQFWVTLLTNLVKANFAALGLLLVVRSLITRHLRQIAAHVADTRVDSSQAQLALDRAPPRRPDDLDKIVAAIHTFDRNARDALAELKKEVRQREKSEHEAREALSVRSNFIGAMSHEVRTPLNAIMGFLHLIEHSDEVPGKHRNYANAANKASHTLNNLLGNMLELSRLDSKDVSIETRPTNVRSLAEQWRDVAEAMVQFRGKPITVSLDLDPALDEIYNLDGARLTQVVTNLIDNAAKFTPSGEIRISIRHTPSVHRRRDTHGIEICVADTGEGIDDVNHHFVFERFTQSDSGIARAHGGIGLGLAIGRQICDLMGAELSLDATERDGFSTRFLITFGCNIRVHEHEY